MLWLIAGTALALISIGATTLSGLGTALLVVAVAVWLVSALRPVAIGPLVANWSRRRLE
jgi:hypothetical protein